MPTVPRDGGNSPLCSSAGLVLCAFEWGEGNTIPQCHLEVKVWWLAVFMIYGMMATSDDRFAADSGLAHPVHDMIQVGSRLLYVDRTKLEYMPRRRAEMLDARSKGHKGDQGQVVTHACEYGSTFVVRGRPLGSTVVPLPVGWNWYHAFRVFPTTPPSRCGFYQVVGYGHALEAIMEPVPSSVIGFSAPCFRCSPVERQRYSPRRHTGWSGSEQRVVEAQRVKGVYTLYKQMFDKRVT